MIQGVCVCVYVYTFVCTTWNENIMVDKDGKSDITVHTFIGTS